MESSLYSRIWSAMLDDVPLLLVCFFYASRSHQSAQTYTESVPHLLTCIFINASLNEKDSLLYTLRSSYTTSKIFFYASFEKKRWLCTLWGSSYIPYINMVVMFNNRRLSKSCTYMYLFLFTIRIYSPDRTNISQFKVLKPFEKNLSLLESAHSCTGIVFFCLFVMKP